MVIRRTVTRDLPNRTRIVARLELGIAPEGERLTEAGLSPHFSTVCDIYEPRSNASGAARQRLGREPDSGGADTEAIARAFPKLKPIADLHLSDPDGVPLHAEANGWYWYAGSRPDVVEQYTGFNGEIHAWQLEERGLPDSDLGRRAYCYRLACEILRVAAIHNDLTREQFTAFVDDQRERWAQEATEARALLESLPEETE